MAFSMEGGKGWEVVVEKEDEEVCPSDESTPWIKVLQEAWSLMAWLKMKSKATCPPSAPPAPPLPLLRGDRKSRNRHKGPRIESMSVSSKEA